MKIVTWNVRYAWNGDGNNSFIHRAGFMYDKIMREMPDVIAFQEIIPASLELLKRMLSEYTFVGSMRDVAYSNEGVYTAYRKDKYECMSSDVFWLSPTPYVAGSRFEDQSPCPRTCTQLKLRNTYTQELFRVLNVHLDHVSDQARQLGVACLFSFMDEYDRKENIPFVLLGDFNALPQDVVMQVCRARKGMMETTDKIPVTFHGFGKQGAKIDYIFISDIWKDRIMKTEAWTDQTNGIYLSDHYPICTEIKDD